MTVNDSLHGFTVTNIREIKEIGGRLVEMKHDATGARLVWADNGDENKRVPYPRALCTLRFG